MLVSPAGKACVRLSRDPGRPVGTSTLSSWWRQLEAVSPDELIILSSNPAPVIRTNIQDSIRGPVSGLDVGRSRASAASAAGLGKNARPATGQLADEFSRRDYGRDTVTPGLARP